nr:plant UBX domain-containing protein 7-like [Ipomoea batatas]GME20901.1 plant UBX domain-containing protein 7-like [Ipomoea batatas]
MDDTVDSFLEVAVGISADTARQFLDAAGGMLDEALALFFANGGVLEQPPLSPSDFGGGRDGDEPSPMVEDLWGSSSSNNGGSNREDNGGNRATDLAALYRPPYELMYYGSFQGSKDVARVQDKWLLVNVQSAGEFASHVLNRDIWADESVAQIIRSSFVFWQYDRDREEGRKVCTYYNLTSMPAVLVIDPITGRNMKSWTGTVQPDTSLLQEGLQPFLDQKPVGIRLPDGRRLQRSFLRSHPVQLLWSFCHLHVGTKPFRLVPAGVPGAPRVVLENTTKMSFEESGISNSMIIVTWD